MLVKRRVLTLKDKLSVVEMREKGYSYARITAEFQIGKSTVFNIVKQKNKLRSFIAERDDGSSRKKMRVADDDSLDRAVYLWFTQERSNGCPISGPLIMEKARMLHAIIYPDDHEDSFKVSHGWLHRYGIRELRFQGESLSADTSAVEPIRQKLLKLIEDQQLTLNQVFNADETGLYWHLLPEKTLAGSYEKTAKNFKKPKDRVSILATANASGNFRLPLLLIGKSKNPRALKNINLSALPVNYKHQKKAWMDSAIFKSWFFDHFIPSVSSYLRGKGYARILVLDNAPSHPQLDILQSPDGAFTCFFSSTNHHQYYSANGPRCFGKFKEKMQMSSLTEIASIS